MKITVKIASVPDRDNLVAELWYKNEQWGEISQETGDLLLEIYPRASGENNNVWSFNLTEIMDKIKEAKKQMEV